MTTDREMLIDLMYNYALENNAIFCDGCGGRSIEDVCKELADSLIANGVTVPKRGHWIIRSSGHGKYANNWAECSECRVCGSPQWKVCPVCETRMEKHSAIKIEEVSEMDFDYTAEDDNA